MRLIDADELIKCIPSEEYASRFAVENTPTIEPEQRWIPVAERLPEVENNLSVRVVVTTSWGLVKEAYFCKDHWTINDIDYKLTSVIAWMPLPEPYKKGG